MVPTLLASQGGTKHPQEIKDSSVFCKLQIVFQTNKCYCCVLSPETQESTVTGFGWEWVEFGGGEACFPETQFYLGLPEGHQQVTGLLGSGHLAASSEGRRENLAKEKARWQPLLERLRLEKYSRTCHLKFSVLLSFTGVQTSAIARIPDSSEENLIVYVHRCPAVCGCLCVSFGD